MIGSVEGTKNRAPALSAALDLAIVVPTYNERANVRPLVAALEDALHGLCYEIIFVDDDSPDGTAADVRQLAAWNGQVRIVQRIGRRGLASACLEGMLATAAPYIAVIDGDLQHDESILPKMLELIRSGELDLVVASRNMGTGGMGEFAKSRVLLSNLGLRLSRSISNCTLSDPMSGYFVVNRQFLEDVAHRTSGIGFKILLDLVASSRRPVRLSEVPYTFRNRKRGESKLDINVGMEYLWLLADKLLGNVVPIRFLLFASIGTLGVAAHLGLLAALRFGGHFDFATSQSLATVLVIALNYTLNNLFTYRDLRRRGTAFASGLVLFYAACGFGFLANLATAEFLFERGIPWFGAGILGLMISAVWNYGVTSVLVWRRRRERLSERDRS